jgi:hypothetical protein
MLSRPSYKEHSRSGSKRSRARVREPAFKIANKRASSKEDESDHIELAIGVARPAFKTANKRASSKEDESDHIELSIGVASSLPSKPSVTTVSAASAQAVLASFSEDVLFIFEPRFFLGSGPL